MKYYILYDPTRGLYYKFMIYDDDTCIVSCRFTHTEWKNFHSFERIDGARELWTGFVKMGFRSFKEN